MTNSISIVPERLEALETIDLHAGGHGDFESGHCAMEVVDWLAGGEGNTDAPACVDPTIASFAVTWNDRLPDDETRNRLLRPHLARMVGTVGQGLSERRSYMALDWMVRTHTVTWLRLAGLTEAADRVAGLAEIVDMAAATAAGDVVRQAQAEAAAAWAAAWDAAGDAAGDAAWDAARAAARDAAGDAAWDAAWAVAWAVARAAARDAAGDAARAAARAAAWAKLAPTVAELQASAGDLLTRMCELKPDPTHGQNQEGNDA